MALQIGIVGLPNVGKSTLFNALTRSSQANVANYPFCTIDPNVGVVEVPDPRLAALASLAKPEKVIPATVEFVDIAGLVKGASKGEGLGNRFLANIRECHAIAEVVRLFQDPNIVHVHGDVSPVRDIEIIQTELLLADLETLQKRLSKAESDAKAGDPKRQAYAALLGRLKHHMEEGRLAYSFFENGDASAVSDLHLLTNKPFLYIVNVHEADVAKCAPEKLAPLLGLSGGDRVIAISAKIEWEIAQMNPEEAQVFLSDFGLREPGLHTLIRAAYQVLGYLTFFTAGPKEVRAWTVREGTKGPQAAAVIHTDFEKKFIAAEVISFEDFVQCGGEQAAKEKGKMRIEGRDYVMKDGDVVCFRV